MGKRRAPRELSLVKVAPRANGKRYPFARDLPLVYLGEIPNLPGHCVVAGSKTGRVYSGYHIETFVELSSDEV
jgi:hypothetical protein